LHLLLIAAIALQPATIIDVQADRVVTLTLRFTDTFYTAEFSRRDLKPDSFKEGDRVQAEVKGNHLTVKRTDGRRVTGRIIQVQRVIVHPIPDIP